MKNYYFRYMKKLTNVIYLNAFIAEKEFLRTVISNNI